MNTSKTIQEIEGKMDGLDPASLRFQVLESVKKFKGNWLELGSYVNLVRKSQSFKKWGFPTFQVYCTRELKLKELTVNKLLRSYRFLQKEEPGFLSSALEEETPTAEIPDYESVDILRKALSRKQISGEDYEKMRSAVFQSEVQPRELGRQYRSLLAAAREADVDPEEAWERNRRDAVKRVLASLRKVRATMETTRIVQAGIINSLKKLIEQVEEEIAGG